MQWSHLKLKESNIYKIKYLNKKNIFLEKIFNNALENMEFKNYYYLKKINN
jgi:hypothetical protein